jgi:hypothetical protein
VGHLTFSEQVVNGGDSLGGALIFVKNDWKRPLASKVHGTNGGEAVSMWFKGIALFEIGAYANVLLVVPAFGGAYQHRMWLHVRDASSLVLGDNWLSACCALSASR